MFARAPYLFVTLVRKITRVLGNSMHIRQSVPIANDYANGGVVDQGNIKKKKIAGETVKWKRRKTGRKYGGTKRAGKGKSARGREKRGASLRSAPRLINSSGMQIKSIGRSFEF